ncbi:MAG: hypothetical protein NE330_16250, partial [Lentisphaeraceae bacterium]|nr:hypothetical protein [Lentisphaeraceae bacterium]
EDDDKSTKENVLVGDFCEPKDLSISLKAVIEKALSVDEEKRYKDCSLMADDIRSYLNGFATSAEDAGLVTLSLLLIKRYKTLFSTVLCFIILISVLTASFIDNLNQEKQSAVKAQEEAELARDAATSAETESMQIRKSASPNFLKYARSEYNTKRYDKAYRLVNKALDLDPRNRHARRFRVGVLVGRHMFEEALEAISSFENQEELVQLKELSSFFLDLKEKGDFLLQPELISKIQLMRHVRTAPGLRMHFLHTCTLNYSLENRLKFARAYFESITNVDFTFKLVQIGDFYKLDMSNNNGMYNVYPLHNLPIIELDISKSSVSDLKPLAKLPLRKLNISSTDVLELLPLANCPLEELNIYKTNVKHIGKLGASSIKELTLNNRWTDLSELDSFKNLQKINIPKGFFNRRVIEDLSKKYEVTEL